MKQILTKLFGQEPQGMAPLEERVATARRLIATADCILIGAGAGLSTAAGLDYAGEDFRRNFGPWIERYGFTNLYDSSFYPFETDEERWAYWARHIWYARYRPGGLPLYGQLGQLVAGKEHFVITTNVDGQFEKAGFHPDRIFATQGDYAYLQPEGGCPARRYRNEEWVMRALEATKDCRIPGELVPHCPDTGGGMAPHLRCDDTFVEDEEWHRQAARYQAFVERAEERKLVLLELGVGFNTPGIIRFPFERMASVMPRTALLRFNRDYPQATTADIGQYVPFTEDIAEVLHGLTT